MRAHELKQAIAYNEKEADEGDLTSQHVVRLAQFWQEHHDLDPDGWAGPQTQKSINTDMERSGFGAALVAPAGEDLFAPWDGPLERRPRNYQEAAGFYGDPGRGRDTVRKAWFRDNIVECHGANRLPGVPAKWYVKIHRLAEAYLREGLRRAQLAAPEYRIKRLGGFVFRHIRWDSDNPLSPHAYGCAVDIDPKDNRGIMFERGKGPVPWSEEWWKIWPRGLPEPFVRAMESCGFTWGGDWRGGRDVSKQSFWDPMHMEFFARYGRDPALV
jgi:hypothetical protein